MASASSEAELHHERVVGEPALEHRDARPVVVELLGGLLARGGRPVARQHHPQLAHLGDPCPPRRRRGRHGRSRRPRRAAAPCARRRGRRAGFRDRAHQRRNLRPEALLELERRGVGVLQAVVQHAGGDDLVRVAAGAQELRDLQRVQDEGGVVGLGAGLRGARRRTPRRGGSAAARPRMSEIPASIRRRSARSWPPPARSPVRGSQHDRLRAGHHDRVLGVHDRRAVGGADRPAVRHRHHVAAAGRDDRLDGDGRGRA